MKKMAGSGGGRFTIRQIYHLTELRRSGLSKEQIMLGLDEIECLKNETADLSFSIEPTSSTTSTPTNIISSSTTNTNEKHKKIAGKKRNYQQLLSELSGAGDINPVSSTSSRPPAAQIPRLSRMTTPLPRVSQQTHPPSKLVKKHHKRDRDNNTPAGCLVISGRRSSNKKDGVPSIPMNNMGKSVSWAEVEDLDPLVRDLLERDVNKVRDELQDFITVYRIRQASIVRELNSRLSQPYLSTWLQNPHSKNFRKVRVLYEWYVEAQQRVKRDGGFISRRKAEKDAIMPRVETSKRAIKSRTGDDDDDDDADYTVNNKSKNKVSSSTAPITQKPQKQADSLIPAISKPPVSPIPASNDLWPSACESFLEEAFQDNLHPNYSARKVIAERCTKIIGDEQQKQGIVGRIPQMVTANQVCVWYINRRKELSRRNSFELSISTTEASTSPRIYPILSPTPTFRSTSPDEMMKIKDDFN